MLGNMAIVRFLEHMGIEYVFHLPGIHTLPVERALAESKIRVVIGRHESGVAFMADGFSRAAGRASVVLVPPGPGLGNVITSCMEASGDDIPLVFIVIDGEKHGDRGLVHGAGQAELLFPPIAKMVLAVSTERELVPALAAAMDGALAPRRGPVVVVVPYRFLEREVPFTQEKGETKRAPAPDAALLEKAVEGSERPVVVGGAALQGTKAASCIDELCAESEVPFLSTTGGKGAIREDRGFAFGGVTGRGTARQILKEADLVIAVGTRLRAADTKRRGVKLPRLVHIDVDERWLGRNYRPDLALAGDLDAAARALRYAMQGRRTSWHMEALRRMKGQEEAALAKKSDGFRIVRLLRRHIPEDTVTVWDPTLVSYWAELYFPAYGPRSFIAARGVSPIFYALPASVGARLAKPQTPCLCVTGDGGLGAIGELATVRAYAVPVVVLVYNNGAYGLLETTMKKRYAVERRMELENPDFVALARSFGIKAERAESVSGLADIFDREVTWDEPYLIDFRYPSVAPPWGAD